MHFIDFLAGFITFIGYWAIIHEFYGKNKSQEDKFMLGFKLVTLSGFAYFGHYIIHDMNNILVENKFEHFALPVLGSLLASSVVGAVYLLKHRTEKLDKLEEEVRALNIKKHEKLDFKKTMSMNEVKEHSDNK